MKVKKHEKYITDLLEKKPHLRDCDMKLLANVWHRELIQKGLRPVSTDCYEFLEMLSQNKLSNPSSIRRCRAKIQELNPHLRGRNYKERQSKRRDTVAKEIKRWDLDY